MFDIITKKYALKFIFFFLLISIGFKGYSQLSKTHFIPPLTFADNGNATPTDQYIYLSTPSAADIFYTITPVGQINEITGVVSSNNPAIIPIGTGIGQLFVPSSQTSTITNNKGYIIEAEGTIYVSIRANQGSQAGALVSKGLSALGTTFRIGSFTNESPGNDYLSFVSIMATEDDTQITFSDLPPGLIIENYTGTTPINITLNKSESYTIGINSDENATNRDGLIGALVNSNKSIVVNCGSTNGSFGSGGGRDYGIDQIAGLSKIGKEYIFVKGDGNNSWENALIVAHSNNTEIYLNGSATPVAIINAGDYYSIEGNNYTANDNMYVETSQDVFAYQGVGGLGNNGSPSEANQGLFFVPPLSCEARGNIDNIANIEDIGSTTYSGGITIVTKAGATVFVTNETQTFPLGNPNTVTGNPDYVTYKITNLTGNVSVQGNDELYVAYFNYNGNATSGSFYSGFPSNPEINFDAQFATLGNCIPNVTLSVANADSFDTYEWFYDDGTGFQTTNISTPDITPNIPGKYKLIGEIICSGLILESVEVPVSLCPDDSDNDGIIDNIDIDNDNDGIQNCTESQGDVIINITNRNSPELIFQDASTNSNIVSGVFTQTSSSGGINDFIGDSDGNFTSTVASASDAQGDYTISFTELINFNFSENTTTPHQSTDGEFFIAKISPANKNITLVDPDNRLLVDTNFDGIFETGVAMTSGSEIHFKINPSPTGNTEYQFLANQVDGFSFIHKLANVNNASTFNGTLSLTCYKNDNDSDGIEDALDLDSDNDGIPDSIENQGTLIALSLVDSDLNGLDDIFDISALPIDTDNDTILDFYDLDSDNDGIYDLIETGQLGTLSDTDLNGIEDGPTYGTNGWTDNAETTPDSNEIGYVLNDLDNDTIFSYLDLDSDGDACSDVIEAGFADGNNDDLLGDTIATTNTSGLVNNASNGYTLPNADYLNFAPLTITTQPIDTTVCEASNTTLSIVSDETEDYHWEFSIDDGINWLTVVDDTFYNGSQTAVLNITNTPLAYNTYDYRVRLDRNGNTCGLYSNTIELTVNPLPIINSPVILIQCDDDDLSTLGFSPFNLTEANNEISSNAANETFSYFLTEAAAINGDITSTDYINTPTTFENRTISNDVVWARIESQLGCASVAQIQLNVSTTVVPSSFVINFNQCDDFLDIDGNDNANNDDGDGIATFDFNNAIAAFGSFTPPGQTPLPPRYFRNEADALAEINEITDPSNYRNIGYPNSQYIYVRIDSDISNDCLALGAHILLTVEALPVVPPVIIYTQCDDDFDGEYSFNTSQIENDILETQNPNDFNITYFDEMGIPLPSPLPNPFQTTTQTITIRVTNNATSAPDGPCYDETTLTFTVDEQPFANAIPDQIVCDGNLGDIDNDGYYPFDTSTFTSTILGTQVGEGMEIQYDYIDEDGNLQLNQDSIPNPLLSENQTINVQVVNPINTTCVASTTINLTINPLPEFDVETPRLVCSSDPTFSIDLEPFESSSFETYNYEWLWTSLDGTTTNQFISNNRVISVSTSGTYSITLTNTDGTNCSRTKTIFVDASEIATITQDDVNIVDLSENNSVTIDTTNLGMGDYEYALQEENSNFINYQTEPVFNNVSPGFYTIYVKDEICGVTPLNISVIGFPKYFTPNGDGVNDLWHIQGIDQSVQPNSTVLIFDRYGKLLKQLLVKDSGWDGTYNGNMLSTDGYWFRVLLEDGRKFSGHFTLKR